MSGKLSFWKSKVITIKCLFIINTVILFVFSTQCSAQESVSVKVDFFIKAQMDKQRIPGLALAVIKDGQVVIAKGYGLANIEHQAPVKPETIFQSGSVGKQFTATAVMMLVEEGKIDLDEKISKYLTGTPKSWENITVRHLLTHTAGMTDYPRDCDFRRDYTEDEGLKLISEIPLAFQPGEKWAYSNLGYVTLGILLNKVTGKFYGDFLHERIFKPLGMNTARIISEADIVPNRAAGYRLVQGEWKNQMWVSPTFNSTADGSLYLTVLDMIKWDAALNTEKLLKKSSLDQMWTPVKLNNGQTYPYGFGWALDTRPGRRVMEHGGAWQGFKSYIARYVDDKLTVIVFANLSGIDITTIVRGVAEFYQPERAAHLAVMSSEQTFILPPSTLLPIPNRSEDPDAPPEGWDGEICIQMGMAYFNKEVSQKTICAAGKPVHSSLYSDEIDPALDALGVQYSSWDWRNQDLAQFLAWVKISLAKGYPVFCGIKMYPTRHPEWSLDHFVLVVGYNEGGLFIDTNNTGDGRILVTYSQLASLINRYSFENKDHRYFGRAFLGVKESTVSVAPAPAVIKPVPQLKPVAVDSSLLKRLTGRYTPGGQARIITFDGETLFSHWEGENFRMLIPLSETEFRFADSETRLRFEFAGDKVIGVIRCPANAPADPLEKRVEPIEDKNPEVTALVQKYIRDAIDGTLKPEVFTDDLAVQIFPYQVKEAGAFLKSLGPQTGIDLYEHEQQGGEYRYLYRLSYGNKIVALRLSVLGDKRISKLDFFLE